MKQYITKSTLNFFKKSEISASSPLDVTAEVKSYIIYELMAGCPAPLLVFEESYDSNQYINYAGWAYASALQDFINGRLPLGTPGIFSEKVAEKYGQDSFEGSTFDNLQDAQKEKFLEMEFAACMFSPLANKDKDFIMKFYSQQNVSMDPTLAAESIGTSTAVGESIIAAPVFEKINDYLEYLISVAPPFFTSANIPALTEEILIPLFMVSEEGAGCDLSAKNIAEKKEQLQNTNIQQASQELEEVLDYLSVYNEKTVYLKKAHIPMVVVCAKKALREKLPAGEFKRIIDEFYKDCPIPYKKASDNGTASKSNVNTRIKSLLAYFDALK